MKKTQFVSTQKSNNINQTSGLLQTEYDAVLNSIPDVIIRISLSGKVVWWNKNLEDITHLSNEKLDTCLFSDLFKSCDSLTSITSVIEEAIKAGSAQIDAFLFTFEGNKRYHLKCNLIETNLEKEVLVVARDIDERTQMSDALRNSQAELQKLIDSLPYLVFLTTTENKYLLANKKFCEFASLSKSKIIGFENRDIFSEYTAKYISRDNEKILSEKCSVHYEVIITVDSNDISLSIDKFPLFDDSDNIYAICGVIEDVTAQYQLQRQLQQIQKMEAIGQLTGGIAHDFNNVLASIMGYTGLAAKHSLQYRDETIKGYLTQITRAGERARDLVQQLLAFSRGDIGGLQVIEPGKFPHFCAHVLLSLVAFKPFVPHTHSVSYILMTNVSFFGYRIQHIQ